MRDRCDLSKLTVCYSPASCAPLYAAYYHVHGMCLLKYRYMWPCNPPLLLLSFNTTDSILSFCIDDVIGPPNTVGDQIKCVCVLLADNKQRTTAQHRKLYIPVLVRAT